MTLFLFLEAAATIEEQRLRGREERKTEQRSGLRWKGRVRKGSLRAHHKH